MQSKNVRYKWLSPSITSTFFLFQFMIVTYIMNIVWMSVTSVCAIPIVIYIMVRSICHWEIEDREIWYYENYCFNLSRFGKCPKSSATKPVMCHFKKLGFRFSTQGGTPMVNRRGGGPALQKKYYP